MAMALAEEELRKYRYRCSTEGCGKRGNDPGDFVAKKVQFVRLGPQSGAVIKARVVGHLCLDCLRRDESWNLPSRTQAVS
jgi:hypothetical protein